MKISIEKQHRFNQLLQQLRQKHQNNKNNKNKLVSLYTKPRYDDIYVEGLKWLNDISKS